VVVVVADASSIGWVALAVSVAAAVAVLAVQKIAMPLPFDGLKLPSFISYPNCKKMSGQGGGGGGGGGRGAVKVATVQAGMLLAPALKLLDHVQQISFYLH
jgi:hypothetical protein